MLDLKNYLKSYSALIEEGCVADQLIDLAKVLISQKESGKRLLLFGNGASASIASHAALDFTKQAKLEAHCFHDPALITAFSNDFGYDQAFTELFKHYGHSDDIVIVISVSGESANVVELARFCKSVSIPVVAFTGRARTNRLATLADYSFWVDSFAYNKVENVHSIWICSIIDYLIGTDVYDVC